jgi:hypothetical protein
MKDEMINFKRNALLGKISGQPLCADYKAALRKCGNDKEMLVRLALMQQSTPYISVACYKNLGLSKEYILNNFGELINGKRTFENVEGVVGYTYQLYVGYDKDFEITADVTSLMWCNGSQIVIKPTKCPTIYVSNKSKVRLVCDGYNTVSVKLFDESELIVEDMDASSEVVVYKYSDKATVELGKFCLKEPKVFNKELRL